MIQFEANRSSLLRLLLLLLLLLFMLQLHIGSIHAIGNFSKLHTLRLSVCERRRKTISSCNNDNNDNLIEVSSQFSTELVQCVSNLKHLTVLDLSYSSTLKNSNDNNNTTQKY